MAAGEREIMASAGSTAATPARLGPLGRLLGARAFGALHVRNYRLYFIAQLVSLSGSSMQMIGQSWLILKLTGSGVDLGGVTAAQFLPLLLGGAWGGMVADRVDKRRLILITQTVSGLLALLLGVLTVTGSVQLWMVFAIAFGLGCVGAVDGPARQVFALEMVGPELLGNAVSLNEVVINASRVFGPAVAGVVIAQFGTSVCFLANAASFAAPVLAVAAIRVSELRPAPVIERSRGQLREGLRYAASTPVVRSLVLIAAAAAMVFNFGVAMPLMAKLVLHAGASGYGAMVAAFGVGALGGAFCAASDPAPDAPRVRALGLITGVVVVFAALMPNLVTELAVLVVTGGTSIWFIAVANATIQLRTAPAMRGRVMGLWSMALPGSLPLTGPLVGWISQTLGGRAGASAAGIAVLAAVAIGWTTLGTRAAPRARASAGS